MDHRLLSLFMDGKARGRLAQRASTPIKRDGLTGHALRAAGLIRN